MAAGKKTTIYRTGASTPTIGEAMSSYATSTTVFKIDNRTKKVINLEESYTFKEDGVPILSTDIETIDNLVGLVEFKTAKTGVITADYEYLLLDELCLFRDISLTVDYGLQGNDVFCTGKEYATYEDTLRSGSGSLNGYEGREDSINDDVLNNDGLVLIVNVNTNFELGFKLLTTSTTYDSAIDALVSNSYSFNSDGKVQVYLS